MASSRGMSVLPSYVLAVLLLLTTLPNPALSQKLPNGLTPSGTSLYEKQLGDELQNRFPFCVANGQQDEQDTFGFDPPDPSPLTCRTDTIYNNRRINRLDGPPLSTTPSTGEYTAGRVCTKAELRIYFDPNNTAGVPTSLNCDPTSPDYLLGCAPGYASWTTSANVQLDSNVEPPRSDALNINSFDGVDVYACCDGFFCPENLACMIPCPKGAYCPKSSNPPPTTDGRGPPFCYPYPYKAVSWTVGSKSQLMCGGASVWNGPSALQANDGIFCDAGMYCPHASGQNNKRDCPKGYYCRKGSTEAKKCSKLATCRHNEDAQDLKGAGIAFVVILLIVLAVTYYLVDYVSNMRLEQVEKQREKAEQKARAAQLAKERWQRAGQKIITAIRKQNKEQGGPRPLASRPQDLYGLATPPQKNGGDLYGAPPAGDLYGAAPTGNLYGAPADGTSATGDLYGASAGGDLYGAGPGPQVEMTKRNKRVNYEDVYAELAAQNKARNEEGNVFDSILNLQMGARKIRVQLELEFREVNLFLKSNGRKLLDNISGTLKPGRVTAVMGPSGAGKSMFLTAVAGKETYCNMTGEVLINGQAGNIQAYKRIIGFVPQDDIVHGNLTVEENLWFSANYRLPRSMTKRSKVLIVERTLLSLGIDHIRHSRVGTVEQRGISGGQRKRVNVGLEMVIDPSLLILDEPTSGLDSTSSFKVLQALRQEAARGVNIGVVLHQPSYKLFHMFHDVMFLMPGGKVVYLGPVRQAEEYFASLGFPIPDRVNPPDHYMDVLAGEVPSTLENFDIKRLPELWLETQGRPRRTVSSMSGGHVEIPIADNVSILHPDEKKGGKINPMSVAESFTARVSQDIKARYHQHKEDFLELFRKQENKSGRVTPGFFRQFMTMYSRLCKQQFRSMRVLFQDYVILLITGAALGLLTPTKDSQLGGAGAYTNSIIAVSLLAMIAGLRTFNLDTLNFYRESASGINKLAYFLAKDLSDWPHIVLKPIFYMALFYFFNDPRSTFASNVGITIALVYCVTGVSYVLATLMPPSSSQLAAAVVTLIASVIAGKGTSGGIVKVFYALSFARWALEAYVLANVRRYSGVWLLTRCVALQKAGYDIGDYGLCIFMLIFFGLLARWGAFMLLIGLHRDKQK